MAQRQIKVSNALADAVLRGQYNPSQFQPTLVINDRLSIINGLVNDISADSIQHYLEVLSTFGNRNTGSDTSSSTNGIGAARRWIAGKMQEFSQANENRLIVGYLDFEELICTMNHHRNVMAVLPGLDTSKKEVLVVEAHMDSRCEGRCDLVCDAPGMDDNGSGTVLVMELARTMSNYAFDRTIVFTTVTGEEQSLKGSAALATYFKDNNIQVHACFNNDVVGGIHCGVTSSPPGCAPPGDVDSTTLRIFSYSKVADTAHYSEHKQLARYVRLQQEEEINPRIQVPMFIDLQLSEDRQGRGGDHIPFRREGFTTLRFTSANEHGDGSGTGPDRQHTTTDVLGVDTDVPPDGIIDSFFVDMRYLARNAITNGVNLGLLAQAPSSPLWTLKKETNKVRIEINGKDTLYKDYRIGVRSLGSGTLYFDTVYSLKGGINFELPEEPENTYFISVANVQGGVESLFSEEQEVVVSGIHNIGTHNVKLHSYPNPAREQINITFEFEQPRPDNSLYLRVVDISGKQVVERAVRQESGRGSATLSLAGWQAGVYQCLLQSESTTLGSLQFVVESH
jgi:hypothetical protein